MNIGHEFERSNGPLINERAKCNRSFSCDASGWSPQNPRRLARGGQGHPYITAVCRACGVRRTQVWRVPHQALVVDAHVRLVPVASAPASCLSLVHPPRVHTQPWVRYALLVSVAGGRKSATGPRIRKRGGTPRCPASLPPPRDATDSGNKDGSAHH